MKTYSAKSRFREESLVVLEGKKILFEECFCCQMGDMLIQLELPKIIKDGWVKMDYGLWISKEDLVEVVGEEKLKEMVASYIVGLLGETPSFRPK